VFGDFLFEAGKLPPGHMAFMALIPFPLAVKLFFIILGTVGLGIQLRTLVLLIEYSRSRHV
jgi:hypothetical protein